MNRRLPIAFILSAAACTSSADADRTLEELRDTMIQHLREAYQDHPRRSLARFVLATDDLNGDGRFEAIAQVSGICPTGGCGFVIFTPHRGPWKPLEVYTGHAPVRRLTSRHNGWHDIGVIVAGGGAADSYEARLQFDGETYPDNPSSPTVSRVRQDRGVMTLVARGTPASLLFPEG